MFIIFLHRPLGKRSKGDDTRLDFDVLKQFHGLHPTKILKFDRSILLLEILLKESHHFVFLQIMAKKQMIWNIESWSSWPNAGRQVCVFWWMLAQHYGISLRCEIKDHVYY